MEEIKKKKKTGTQKWYETIFFKFLLEKVLKNTLHCQFRIVGDESSIVTRYTQYFFSILLLFLLAKLKVTFNTIFSRR